MPKRSKPWQKQERKLDREGARRVPQSGAGYLKGDGKGENYLVQAKTTEKRSYSLKLADLRKATAEAHTEERIPVTQLQFEAGDERYAVLRWQDFTALLEAAGQDL